MNQSYFALSLLLLAMAGPMLAVGRVSNQSSLTLRVGHAAPDSESQATSFAEPRSMTTTVRVVDNTTGDVHSEFVTADTMIYLVSRTIEKDDELAEEMIDETLQTISGSIFDVLDVLSPSRQSMHASAAPWDQPDATEPNENELEVESAGNAESGSNVLVTVGSPVADVDTAKFAWPTYYTQRGCRIGWGHGNESREMTRDLSHLAVDRLLRPDPPGDLPVLKRAFLPEHESPKEQIETVRAPARPTNLGLDVRVRCLFVDESESVLLPSDDSIEQDERRQMLQLIATALQRSGLALQDAADHLFRLAGK